MNTLHHLLISGYVSNTTCAKMNISKKSSSRTRNYAQKEAHVGSFLRSPENSDQSTEKLLFTKNAGLISLTAIWLNWTPPKTAFIFECECWSWCRDLQTVIVITTEKQDSFPQSNVVLITTQVITQHCSWGVEETQAMQKADLCYRRSISQFLMSKILGSSEKDQKIIFWV